MPSIHKYKDAKTWNTAALFSFIMQEKEMCSLGRGCGGWCAVFMLRIRCHEWQKSTAELRSTFCSNFRYHFFLSFHSYWSPNYVRRLIHIVRHRERLGCDEVSYYECVGELVEPNWIMRAPPKMTHTQTYIHHNKYIIFFSLETSVWLWSSFVFYNFSDGIWVMSLAEANGL